MAFVATLSTSEPRAIPHGGPLRSEILTYTAASGDVSGTVTSKNLHTIYHCLIDGLQSTSAPTFSGSAVTLAFVDPVATVAGTIVLIGV